MKMENRIVKGFFLLLISSCLMIRPAGLHADLTEDAAQALLDGYIRAVQKGNDREIRAFWSTRFTSEDFFRDLPICLDESAGWAEYKTRLQKKGTRYRVKTVSGEKDCTVVQSELFEGSAGTKPGREMPFYVHMENGRWKLADPSRILTRDWKSHETGRFVFVYPAEIDISRYSSEIDFMERTCLKLEKIFGLKLTRRIRYYYTPSDELTGQLLTSSPAQGYCTRSKHPERDPWFNFITSQSLANSHELVHALTALKGIPDINAFFLEGLAVALEGITWTSRDFSIIETIRLMESGKVIDIRALFTDESFFKVNRIAYHECGAFVHFLLKKHGLKKYLEFCQAFATEPDIPKNIRRHFGQDLDRIIGEWKADLLAQSKGLSIGYQIPKKLVAVFSMDDEKGDDHGPGTYRYPTHEAFKRGICDIERFAIFSDETRVYFRVTMNRMIKPVFNPETKETFTPAVYVCIMNPEKGGMPSGNFSGIPFRKGEGYHVLISAGFGVSVTDQLRKKVIISEKSIDRMRDEGARTLSFSLPVALIGTPRNSWKIMLISGLQTDYGEGVTYGNPVDIEETAGPFVCGGAVGEPVPRFFDILLPPGQNQRSLFAELKQNPNRSAGIAMLSLK